jgi:hypothetical protein
MLAIRQLQTSGQRLLRQAGGGVLETLLDYDMIAIIKVVTCI